MTALSALAIVMTVCVILLFVHAPGPRLFPGVRIVRRSFWCAFRKQNVDVDFEETVWDAKRLDVCRCSAFPGVVSCQKSCVALRHLPARY